MLNKFDWTTAGKDAYMILFHLHKNREGKDLWEKLVDRLEKDVKDRKLNNDKENIDFSKGPRELSPHISRYINFYVEEHKNGFGEQLKSYFKRVRRVKDPIDTSAIRYLFTWREEKCGSNICTIDVIVKYIYGMDATFAKLFLKNWDDVEKYLHPSYREAYKNVRKGIVSAEGREAVPFSDDFDCLYKKYHDDLFPFEQYSSTSSGLSTREEQKNKEEEITGSDLLLEEKKEMTVFNSNEEPANIEAVTGEEADQSSELPTDLEKSLTSKKQELREEEIIDNDSSGEEQEKIIEDTFDENSVDTESDQLSELSADSETPLTSEEQKLREEGIVRSDFPIEEQKLSWKEIICLLVAFFITICFVVGLFLELNKDFISKSNDQPLIEQNKKLPYIDFSQVEFVSAPKDEVASIKATIKKKRNKSKSTKRVKEHLTANREMDPPIQRGVGPPLHGEMDPPVQRGVGPPLHGEMSPPVYIQVSPSVSIKVVPPVPVKVVPCLNTSEHMSYSKFNGTTDGIKYPEELTGVEKIFHKNNHIYYHYTSLGYYPFFLACAENPYNSRNLMIFTRNPQKYIDETPSSVFVMNREAFHSYCTKFQKVTLWTLD